MQFASPAFILGSILILEFGLIAACYRIRNSSYQNYAWLPIAMLFFANFSGIYFCLVIFGLFGSMFTVPLILISLLFNWVYNGNARQAKRIFTPVFLLGLWIVALLFCVVIYGAGNVGLNLFCANTLLICSALILHWPRQPREEKEKNAAMRYATTTRISFIAMLLLSYIVPYFAYFTYLNVRSFCALQNEGSAKPIIEAIEAYRTDNSRYPYYLTELIPNYLEEIPNVECNFASFLETDALVEYHICLETAPYLSLYILGNTQFAYAFSAKEWFFLEYYLDPCGEFGQGLR